MWDLNAPVDQRREEEDAEMSCVRQNSNIFTAAEKGNGASGSPASMATENEDSGSSAVVIEASEDARDDEEEEEGAEENTAAFALSGIGKRGGGGGCKKIFGFSIANEDDEERPLSGETGDPVIVTHQFFPVDNYLGEMGSSKQAKVVTGCGSSSRNTSNGQLPQAHWVGVKFCHDGGNEGGKKAATPAVEVSVSQPIKKSRRGPRSRSSQYRGVTFYRRTGRWESHIWYVTK